MRERERERGEKKKKKKNGSVWVGCWGGLKLAQTTQCFSLAQSPFGLISVDSFSVRRYSRLVFVAQAII